MLPFQVAPVQPRVIVVRRVEPAVAAEEVQPRPGKIARVVVFVVRVTPVVLEVVEGDYHPFSRHGWEEIDESRSLSSTDVHARRYKEEVGGSLEEELSEERILPLSVPLVNVQVVVLHDIGHGDGKEEEQVPNVPLKTYARGAHRVPLRLEEGVMRLVVPRLVRGDRSPLPDGEEEAVRDV